MSIDAASLDAIVTAVGWIVGLSLFLVGGSIVGYGFWWAMHLEPPGLVRLFLRAGLVWFGIFLLTLGAAFLAWGTEFALGTPFGQSSGGLVLFAYLLGLRLGTLELAASHGLLQQLARRTDAGLHRALAVMTGAAMVSCWGLTYLHAFLCFVVALNMAFGG